MEMQVGKLVETLEETEDVPQADMQKVPREIMQKVVRRQMTRLTVNLCIGNAGDGYLNGTVPFERENSSVRRVKTADNLR